MTEPASIDFGHFNQQEAEGMPVGVKVDRKEPPKNSGLTQSESSLYEDAKKVKDNFEPQAVAPIMIEVAKQNTESQARAQKIITERLKNKQSTDAGQEKKPSEDTATTPLPPASVQAQSAIPASSPSINSEQSTASSQSTTNVESATASQEIESQLSFEELSEEFDEAYNDYIKFKQEQERTGSEEAKGELARKLQNALSVLSKITEKYPDEVAQGGIPQEWKDEIMGGSEPPPPPESRSETEKSEVPTEAIDKALKDFIDGSWTSVKEQQRMEKKYGTGWLANMRRFFAGEGDSEASRQRGRKYNAAIKAVLGGAALSVGVWGAMGIAAPAFLMLGGYALGRGLTQGIREGLKSVKMPGKERELQKLYDEAIAQKRDYAKKIARLIKNLSQGQTINLSDSSIPEYIKQQFDGTETLNWSQENHNKLIGSLIDFVQGADLRAINYDWEKIETLTSGEQTGDLRIEDTKDEDKREPAWTIESLREELNKYEKRWQLLEKVAGVAGGMAAGSLLVTKGVVMDIDSEPASHLVKWVKPEHWSGLKSIIDGWKFIPGPGEPLHILGLGSKGLTAFVAGSFGAMLGEAAWSQARLKDQLDMKNFRVYEDKYTELLAKAKIVPPAPAETPTPPAPPTTPETPGGGEEAVETATEDKNEEKTEDETTEEKETPPVSEKTTEITAEELEKLKETLEEEYGLTPNKFIRFNDELIDKSDKEKWINKAVNYRFMKLNKRGGLVFEEEIGDELHEHILNADRLMRLKDEGLISIFRKKGEPLHPPPDNLPPKAKEKEIPIKETVAEKIEKQAKEITELLGKEGKDVKFILQKGPKGQLWIKSFVIDGKEFTDGRNYRFGTAPEIRNEIARDIQDGEERTYKVIEAKIIGEDKDKPALYLGIELPPSESVKKTS